MKREVFLSCRMSSLLEGLFEQIDKMAFDPLEGLKIVVPNSQVKQWLLLEIAKKKGIAMGLKIEQIEQLLPKSIGSVDLFCAIYREISQSKDSELLEYLDGLQKRLLDLSEQLSSLFFSYGQYGQALFEKKAEGWQEVLLHKLFVEGPWKMAVQQTLKLDEPIFCFAIDTLAPIYWDFLLSAPSICLFHFSPCAHFWEDTCTDRERKSLNRKLKKKGIAKSQLNELDFYLQQAPKNLANWGKIGRQTLKVFDPYDLQMEADYPEIEPKTALKKIQSDLLHFEETKKIECDDSIQVFLTGSSKLKEIELIREEIIRLNIAYHEIVVLAPDIEPYVPFIEFVFSDIPNRISGFDLAPQSSFRQGLIRLLKLATGRWSVEDMLTLFETPSFYQKRGWNQEKLAAFRKWISTAGIQWGRDPLHRKEILTKTLGEKSYLDHGSWEKGLDLLLEVLVFYHPMQMDLDLFEEFFTALTALKKLCFSMKKTLKGWGDELESIADQFLTYDKNDEADQATVQSFQQMLFDLRNSEVEGEFPLAVIQKLLIRPSFGQIHASHLHAVRFTSIAEGALLGAKAVFLIGMSEENFPRVKIGSSLDLLKGKVPSQADRDRYLFLQALFSAEEYLRISYCHLSEDEGKPVGPSLVVQELLSSLDLEPTICKFSEAPPSPKRLAWPKRANICNVSCSIPSTTIQISELRRLARHPWKFFLQKVHGIYLKDSLEETFALQKGKLLRESLQKPLDEKSLPPGPFGSALKLEIEEKLEQWKELMAQWQIEPCTIVLRENCSEAHWEGAQYIAPALEIACEGVNVRIVGELQQVCLKGLICSHEDNIAGLLKVWPEALITALSVNEPHVWFLKNGKTKTLGNIKESLSSFIGYYFQSLAAPSPLLSEWADPLLRKGAADLEKKMEKGSLFEDPVMEWVLARSEEMSAEEIFSDWAPTLQNTFKELIQLYPTRGKTDAKV